MRRAIWRGLAVASGYVFAATVHHAAAHWGWYDLRPGVVGDDPLALIVGVGTAWGLWWGLDELYRS